MILRAVVIIAGLILIAGLTVPESRIPILPQPQFSMCSPRTMNQDTPCPVFAIQCSETEEAGKTIAFKVPGLYGPLPSRRPSYSWKISAGRILKGQGTDTILVDTRHVKAESIKGRVKVGGFPRECSMVAACSVLLLRN